MGKNGWVDVAELIEKAQKHGKPLSPDILTTIVQQDEKQRYSFNSDLTQIRANQGHSVPIDLGLHPIKPPQFLYHGTAVHHLESISRQGLQKQKRHHVHLSEDRKTAKSVGSRYGKPVILTISAGEMFKQGCLFYMSENRVWLTDQVLPHYISFPEN